MPGHGGLVLDLTRLKGIVDDRQPGSADRHRSRGNCLAGSRSRLATTGLALRLYPTSAPGSTVGGWLAQGGAGIGSHAYGWFKENVVSRARRWRRRARFGWLRGRTRRHRRRRKARPASSVEVTLKVRPLAEQEQLAVGFDDANVSADRHYARLAAAELPIWSISFINPTMAQSEERRARRKPTTAIRSTRTAGAPPGGHLSPCCSPSDGRSRAWCAAGWPDRRRTGGQRLLGAPRQARVGGTLQADAPETAWPLGHPGRGSRPSRSAWRGARRSGREDRRADGHRRHLGTGGEVVLLGFIPHDERTFAYNFGYGFALTAIAIAEKHGGRGYSTGRYFGGKADSILGSEKVQASRATGAEVDPEGILNPGKVVFGNGLIGAGHRARPAPSSRLVRTLPRICWASPPRRARQGAGQGISRPTSPTTPTPAPSAATASTLHPVPGTRLGVGRPAREMVVLEGRPGRSGQVRPGDDRHLPTVHDLREVRRHLPAGPADRANLGTDARQSGPGARLRYLPAVRNHGRGAQGPEEHLGRPGREARRMGDRRHPAEDQGAARRSPTLPAAPPRFVEPDIAQSATKLLDAAGVEFTYLGKDEMCCGIPMLVAGKWDVWEESLRHNVAAMEKKGVEEVITSCPACWLVWNTYYPQWAEKLGIDYHFTAKHYSQVLAEKIGDGSFTLPEVPETFADRDPALGPAKVTFHDSCHIGRAGGVYEPPRDLIKAIPGVQYVEMAHHHENALCCGSVLTRIGEPDPTSIRWARIRVHEAEASGADALLALCPCCQFQLRVSANNAGSTLPVIDLARLSAEALGVKDLPDPNPEVLYQWAMFEKFINLMSVDGMVEAMDALTPQLLAAMPLGMGRMMRAIGHAPAFIREPMFTVMAPMMPRLFPILLPGMMPKVLPSMIQLVEDTIEMPDYLRQQLPGPLPRGRRQRPAEDAPGDHPTLRANSVRAAAKGRGTCMRRWSSRHTRTTPRPRWVGRWGHLDRLVTLPGRATARPEGLLIAPLPRPRCPVADSPSPWRPCVPSTSRSACHCRAFATITALVRSSCSRRTVSGCTPSWRATSAAWSRTFSPVWRQACSIVAMVSGGTPSTEK